MKITPEMIQAARDADWKVEALSEDALTSALEAVLRMPKVRAALLAEANAGLAEEPEEIGAQVIDCEDDVWEKFSGGWGVHPAGILRPWSWAMEYAPLRRIR